MEKDLQVEAYNENAITEARETLKNAGYHVDNLWSLEDVQIKYNCTEEEAMNVLIEALKNEATMEQIWLAIDVSAETNGLKAK